MYKNIPIIICLALQAGLGNGCSLGEPFACADSYGFYPCPDDCSQYYVCDHNLPHLFTCPAGLYYDPILRVCNYPNKVPCTKDSTYDAVCEGSTMHLTCPLDKELRVTAANYGRTSESAGLVDNCKKGPARTNNCVDDSSLKVVQDKCNGRISCEVQATNSVFGDPCRYTKKILYVHYTCV